jgi:hypothetical protein
MSTYRGFSQMMMAILVFLKTFRQIVSSEHSNELSLMQKLTLGYLSAILSIFGLPFILCHLGLASNS